MGQAENILEDLKSGDFKLTTHARQRMNQRNVTMNDIKTCAQNAKVTVQADGTFKVEGYDEDSEELTLICAVSNGTLIVTVY